MLNRIRLRLVTGNTAPAGIDPVIAVIAKEVTAWPAR
ncbi:MAG: hypothetical protein JWQ27_1817 [Ferruginibacter sp.]|nr:hypothetical protein [Ferruginibacter sp.]